MTSENAKTLVVKVTYVGVAEEGIASAEVDLDRPHTQSILRLLAIDAAKDLSQQLAKRKGSLT